MTTILFIALSLILFYLFVGIFGMKVEDDLVYILLLVIVGVLLNINYKLSEKIGNKNKTNS